MRSAAVFERPHPDPPRKRGRGPPPRRGFSRPGPGAYLGPREQTLQQLPGDRQVALPWGDSGVDPQTPAAYDAPQLDGADTPLSKTPASVPSANPPIDQ